MKRQSKVIPALSGALTLGGISSQLIACDLVGEPEKAEAKQASQVQDWKQGQEKTGKQVKKVQQAKRHLMGGDDDRYGMPAGTMYDVLGREDLA